MKSIYLVFTQTGTSASKLFKVFTHMPYNHASISFDKELYDMYSFGRRMLYCQFVAGFIKENPDTHVYKRFPNTVCMVVELSVTDEQYEIAKKELFFFLIDGQKYKYDILGVPARAAGLKWQRNDRFVCSEFVGLILSRAKVLSVDEEDCYFLRPSDLYRLPNSRILYIGTLKGYNRGHFDDNLEAIFSM